MTPTLLLLAALAQGAAAADTPCAAPQLDAARREFKTAYDAGRVREAFDALAAVREACRSFLSAPGEQARRLWTISDLALAALKLGELDTCRDLIEPLEDEYFTSGDVPGLKAAWSSLAFNYHECDCYDVKRPLCRARSWLKDGYGESEESVHPDLPPLRIRLVFEVKDTPETRSDGSTYVGSDADLVALEVRSLSGSLIQRLPVSEGITDYLGSGTGGPPLEMRDANFDGYLDISAGNYCGNGACCTSRLFLYQPAQRRFAYDEQLSGICFAEVDAEKKEIRSSWRASACEHGQTTYRYEKGRLVIAEQQTETIVSAADPDAQCCSDDESAAGQCLVETVTERRVDGQLKEVSRTREKPKP